MKQITKFVAVILLALLVTACSKPEKQELSGTWRWKSTMGGFAGDTFTPESEGFEAEFVFKGGTFTFYKDGKKVTSGAYSINYDIDVSRYQDSRFRFKISDAQVKKISDATYGKITLVSNPSGLVANFGYSEAQEEVLSLRDGRSDGYTCTFVKKQ